MHSSSAVTSRMSMDDMFNELDKFDMVKIPLFKNKYYKYQWAGNGESLYIHLFNNDSEEIGFIEYNNHDGTWQLFANKHNLKITLNPITLKFK